MERTYYTINELTAKVAKEINSFSGYAEGSATREYQAKVNEVYDIVDDYLAEEENDLTSLITLVMKIFEVSGYFRQGAIKNNKQPNE